MRNLLFRFCLLFALLSVPVLTSADVIIPLIPSTPPGEPEPDELGQEDGKKGPRMPAAPVYCEIDFEANSLTGPAILDEVTIYEVWSEDGAVCLGICGDAESFVLTLKTYPSQSTYMLKLRGDTFALVGYLYLD